MEVDSAVRNRDGPLHRISDAGLRAFPGSSGRSREIGKTKWSGLRVRANQSTAGIGVNAPIAVAHAVQHEFGSVVQLDAEPIPSRLLLGELFRSEFMVNPAIARSLKISASDRDGPRRGYASHRVIVRRAAGAFCFLTHAVLAMNNRRFV